MSIQSNIDTTSAGAKLLRSQLSDQLEGLAANIDLSSLKLALKGAASFDASEARTDVGLARTILGSSTVTVNLEDPSGAILNSGIFGSDLTTLADLNPSLLKSGVEAFNVPVDISIDGVWFRLVGLKISDPTRMRTLQLVFEDREVAVMRSYPKAGDPDTYKTFAVQNFDRIGVIKWLIEQPTEIKGGIRWVIGASIAKTGSLQGSSIEKSSEKLDDITRLVKRYPGLPKQTASTVTVKGVTATKAQQAVIHEVLDVGVRMDMSAKLLIIAVMVITDETRAGADDGTDPRSVGPFQQTPGWGGTGGTGDASIDAGAFFTEAVTLDARFPNLSYGQLADQIQRPEAFLQGKDPNGLIYGKYQAESENTVLAYQGEIAGDASTSNPALPPSSAPVVEGNAAQFTRGTEKVVGTVKKAVRENNWACAQRLATEVGWRVFCVSGTLYVMTDSDILHSQVQQTFSRDTDGVTGIGFQIDTGKSDAIVTVNCQAPRWGTPPGACCAIEGMGPIDGRWIVQTISRTSLLQIPTVITLSKPQPVLADAESASPIQASGLVIGELNAAGTAGSAPQLVIGGNVVQVARQALADTADYLYEKLRPMPNALGVGTPTGPERLDCSSFVTLVYKGADAPNPNGGPYNDEGDTGTLIANGTPIQQAQLQPGDLVFYGGTLNFPQHVAIFVGNNQVIQMGQTGKGVQLEPLDLGGVLPIIACCTYDLTAPVVKAVGP